MPWDMTNVPVGALVSHDVFYSHALRALPDAVLYSDYERWRSTGFKRVLTTPLVLCHYPFLLDAAAKRKLLEYEAALQMSSGATQALLQRALVPGVSPSPFLELQVSGDYFGMLLRCVLISSSAQVRREHLVRDVANQIAATPPTDLKKKLRVTFVGEEALDAGGECDWHDDTFATVRLSTCHLFVQGSQRSYFNCCFVSW